MSIRFAVLGDIHYVEGRFHTRRPSADRERHEAARRTYYERLAGEIRAARPDFVVQLGDLLEGGWDEPEQAKEELEHALAWLSSFGCPAYPIRGNHDDSGPAARACEAILAPYLAKLGLPRRESFSYELTAGGARFVFVDCRESIERPATRAWLHGLRQRAREGERPRRAAAAPGVHSRTWWGRGRGKSCSRIGAGRGSTKTATPERPFASTSVSRRLP